MSQEGRIICEGTHALTCLSVARAEYGVLLSYTNQKR